MTDKIKKKHKKISDKAQNSIKRLLERNKQIKKLLDALDT